MAYTLSSSYVGESLVSGFSWFDGSDLSHGYVAYQGEQAAAEQGLWSIDPDTNVVRLGVDSTNKYSLDEGRPSIRLESKEAFNHGLFIADFLHMPPSQCGVWPAFWAYGNDWPNGGEVDMIEGSNKAYKNIITAHTAEGCVLDPADSELYAGQQRTSNCAVGGDNVGCGFSMPNDDVSSYGDGFNAANGGVYAMMWDAEYIRVWHFTRGSIPEDIEAKEPQPDNWGLPDALFGGSKCDVDSFFKNMNIVLNINFCGDYGDATWTDTCGNVAPTCREYVANNPEAFVNAYWEVQYIDVYEVNGNTTVSTTVSTTTSTTASTTAVAVSTTESRQNGTATATRTASSTETVTVPGGGVVVEVPCNPSRILEYSYLGCFGSKSGFATFEEVKQSDEMTLELCVESCNGITYAGVFEGKCFCADKLDAATRALAAEGSCNRRCPGNDEEFCGGIIDYHPGNSSLAMRSINRRGLPADHLLSVYGAVINVQPAPAPAMATYFPKTRLPVPTFTRHPQPLMPTEYPQYPEKEVTTTVQYTSVAPNKNSYVVEEYVATLTAEDCEDGESQTIYDVPMETRVVECQLCEVGVEYVTITVPVTQTEPVTKSALPDTKTVETSSSSAARNMTLPYKRPDGKLKGGLFLDKLRPFGDAFNNDKRANVPTTNAEASPTGKDPASKTTESAETSIYSAEAQGGWNNVQLSWVMSMVLVVAALL